MKDASRKNLNCQGEVHKGGFIQPVRAIQHHIEKYQISHPELLKVLMQSIYVDDVAFGADMEDAYPLYASLKEILGHGLVKLRKFVTNFT